MADANPAEVAIILQQIYQKLDEIVTKRVQEALGQKPGPGTTDSTKILAKQIYNLCMQSGMPIAKELEQLMR